MSELAIHRAGLLPLPQAKTAITIRAGVMSDVPFMDQLQKIHTKQVGWMPTAQFEGKIRAGHVLIAEATGNDERGMMNDEVKADASSVHRSSFILHRSPVGYCIAQDRYFKRDDVGIIYQMNVLPGRQRGFIGAALLKAQFERSAYGCKLYCCWCAQDIAANHFWEAMGFVPLAFRTGSRTKGKGRAPRVHIFWQKRIGEGDTTTPWWFPCQTGGGAIREDRLVLPIPPGVHWSDVMPTVLPVPSEAEGPGAEQGLGTKDLGLSQEKPKAPRAAESSTKSLALSPKSSVKKLSALRFAPPAPVKEPKPKRPKAAKTHTVKSKNDPKLIAAARELRDRWLEQVNANPALMPAGKYEVSRTIEHRRADVPMLPAA